MSRLISQREDGTGELCFRKENLLVVPGDDPVVVLPLQGGFSQELVLPSHDAPLGTSLLNVNWV